MVGANDPNKANRQEEIERPLIGNQNLIAGAPNEAGLEEDRLRGEIADLQRQREESTQVLDGLQGEIADLQRQHEESTQVLDRLRGEIADLQRQRGESTQVLDRLRRELDGELNGNPTQRKQRRSNDRTYSRSNGSHSREHRTHTREHRNHSREHRTA